MLLFFLLHLAIVRPTFAANRRCPEVHFWNGTACRPCSGCPTGEGVMVNCSIYKDTQCQPCWHGFDYSNTTGMEACQGCDENSNCLPGNFKVIKNCTVSSATVCDGCEAGFYFNKDQGEQGGCVKCSPLCRVDEVETKGCKTEHDRVCSKRASTTENILNPTFFWTETDYNGRDDTTSTPSSDHTDEDLTITKPWAGKYRDMPLHNKPWFWIVVSLCSICIILPTVVFSAAAKRRQRHSDGTQPLIPPHGLDQPIRTLLVEQRSFIAMRLDCKDSQGYGYWQRVAEKVNLANESRAFNSLPNPTEAFLTLYSEKQGSTVRTLVDACEEAGLTHFASEMREKFGAQDHEEIEAGEHESAV
ncbi:tumor necrosis factor receptor superfamily member 16-like isoform X3 [Montipora foliosa]|uniref:tumor necrosis factor receptor superfamily member 16-like isoform X3 n=1 Tax=Montipora foliosa TaxID=591990 RepID=UPI0035F10619